MGSNSEVTPGPQMMTSTLPQSAKIQIKFFSFIFMPRKRDFVENL